MGRRIAIYVCVALAVGAAGIAATLLLDDDDLARPGTKRAALVDEVGRDEVERGVAADAGSTANSDTSTVRVVETEGEASRSSSGGKWVALTPGDLLGVDDTVRVEDTGRVTLQVGDRSKVELARRAEATVKELSSTVQRLGLTYGRASVDYQEDGEKVLRIESEDGRAVAEVRRGKFSILNTGQTVAVATETGVVDLFAAGEKVAVEAGEQSIVADAGPSDPMEIPKDLLLKVADPGCRTQKEAFIEMRGRTNPGSNVRVNETVARVDAEGRFDARVPLRVGRNTIVVVTTDAAGREIRRVFPCVTVDPGAAIENIDIDWGAGAKRGKT